MAPVCAVEHRVHEDRSEDVADFVTERRLLGDLRHAEAEPRVHLCQTEVAFQLQAVVRPDNDKQLYYVAHLN